MVFSACPLADGAVVAGASLDADEEAEGSLGEAVTLCFLSVSAVPLAPICPAGKGTARSCANFVAFFSSSLVIVAGILNSWPG